MSFNLNPINNNQPSIRTSKTQDGGAGNTGYFQQGNKKEDSKEKEKSIFGEQPKDTLTLSTAEQVDYSEPPFLIKVIELIKMNFRRLFNQ